MEMIDFLCPEEGRQDGKPIKIQIPAECCGIKTSVSPSTHAGQGYYYGCNMFDKSRCFEHIGIGYVGIWEKWIERSSGKNISSIAGGCNCICCGMKNEYAIPNQSDGTYRCFECRN